MNTAIIVAAGKGTRFGPDRDKLFMEIAGRPIVAHTWAKFESCPEIGKIILVVRDGMQSAFRTIAAECGFQKTFELVAGGAERQDSVWNGLQLIKDPSDIVAIHDAARPCVTHELIRETLAAAERIGAAVAAQKVTDTIKESDDGQVIKRTVDRSRLYSVQTPQTFRAEVIIRAITTAREKGLSLTDDTAACELIGQAVWLVTSPVANPKVTVPSDLPHIENLMNQGV